MTDVSRRFVFHGAASALSGRVYRPRELAGVIACPAASALTVAGGLSRAEVSKRLRVAPWLTIGGALTEAEGRFDDLKQAIEMSWHRVPEDALTSSTRVTAVVKDLDVTLKPNRLTATLLSAALESSSPRDKSGTPIRLGRKTDVKGLAIDGYPLTVVIDRDRFEAADTLEKLAAGERGAAVSTGASGPIMLTTIVREVKWAKKPHPDATIDKNVVEVKDFGRIFLGELLATGDSRRLTIMRLQLGSPFGISVGVGDVHTDGSWYPP
ncbi:MAG: hypothetical protein ABI634_08490 [Acidobacteriota bacterium]